MTAVALRPPACPRASVETRLAFGLALSFGAINLLAGLSMAPSEDLQDLGGRVSSSHLSPAVAGGRWDLIVAALLFPLAWGLLRRRAAAWGSALALLGVVAAVDIVHHQPLARVAFPVVGIVGLIAVRRGLVAEPYRQLLRRHMIPSAEATQRTAALLAAHGRDALAPFKLRPDVGRLFDDQGEAMLAYRVENRALIVAGDPVGTSAGADRIITTARDLARGAGLRFGVTSASPGLAAHLTEAFGMRSMYMGCEAIIETSTFTLDGHRIKKVRQAHRRVQRAGYGLHLRPAGELSVEDRAAIRACREAARPASEEQSFSMAPESLDGPSCAGAIFCFARHEETGRVDGVLVFMPLAQRSLWSLALQLRDPQSPNGVVDALLVHAIQEARSQDIDELSLNFAAGRRYAHEPVAGFWPRVGRLLTRLAMRWTQIDALRFHNEKFSPRWEQRFLVVDHLLQFPHLAFAAIWQEGQLPRPDAFLAPAWPQTIEDVRPAG